MSILDEDLSTVDVSRPVIKGSVLTTVLIKECRVDQNKAGTGENLIIVMETETALESTKGEPINKGFTLYKYIGLTPIASGDGKRDYTVEDIKRALALFTGAVHGKQIAVNPLDNHIGKVAKVRITMSKPTKEYPDEGNNVNFVLPS